MKTSAGFDLLAALAVLSLNGAAGEKKNLHPVVKIGEMGTAEGTYGHTAWTNRKYQKFIDIPYGSTSYEGRFLPPKPPEPFDETYNAYTSDVPCPSLKNLDDILSYGDLVDYEDCLHLTISTPNRSASLPVMVYLAGYDLDDTENEDAEPDYLLEKDIVLVSVQYRGGPFGFLSTLGDEMPGNVGVMDVILALQFINKMIKYFGGDEKRVTLFGQYKNAALVHILTMTPFVEKDALFQRVIYQSGSALMSGLTTRDPAKYVKEMGKHIGCKDYEDIAAVTKCLKTCEVASILYAYRDMKREHGNIPWFSIGGPVKVLPDEPRVLLEKGTFYPYPAMGGVVKHAAMGTGQLDNTEKIYHNFIEEFEKSLQKCAKNDQQRAIMSKEFPSKVFSRTMLTAIWPGVVDLHSLDVKESTSTALVYNSNKENSYLYAFNYLGQFNRLQKSIDEDVADVSLTDDNLYLFPFRPGAGSLSKDDSHMAKIMVDLWTSFACDGVPDSPLIIGKWSPMIKGKVGPYMKLDTVPEVGFYYPDEFFTSVLDTRQGFTLD